MEIQALTLLVTEQDLNDMLARHLPPDQPLENLKVRVAPEGAYVTGDYPLFVRVSFETLWDLDVHAGKVTARLANLQAMGLPATMFNAVVLKAIEDAIQNQPGLTFDKDTIKVDLDQLLAAEGIPLKTNLKTVHCQTGSLVIAAGAP
jgi:hypothetical protein